MATHRFVCPKCGKVLEDDNARLHVCPDCGEEMNWDIAGIGIPEGDYNHVSSSLAINPSQATAHRKLFPDVDVKADGQLHFRSVNSQERYCEKTGFHKAPQKLKSKGTRIA